MKTYHFLFLLLLISCHNTDKTVSVKEKPKAQKVPAKKVINENKPTPIENSSVGNTNFKICELPFDFDEYYNTCFGDDQKCKERYPSYYPPASDSVLESLGITETPPHIFMLPKKGVVQPVILANDETDVEGYTLCTSKDGKLISTKQIGEMDGESILDFTITEDYKIKLFRRKNTTEKRVLTQTLQLLPDGMIK